MPEIPENTPLFDQSIQTENIAFDPVDLIACDNCGRKNPPTRFDCIYCANELAVEAEDAASIRHFLRKLEIWESGFNVIISEKSGTIDIPKIAQLLSMAVDDLMLILDTGSSLPLARLENEKEASLIQTGLGQLGLKCSLVSDADLAANKPPVRISGIEFFDDSLAFIDFNTGSLSEVAAEDLVLLVSGVITASRIDTLETKRRRANAKLIDESATASDESILDIFSRKDANGFRVHLAGFDFSCLGEDKGLLASENMQRLAILLGERAPNAGLVDDYKVVRQALGIVWEVESRKDSLGLQRSAFTGVKFGSVASTSNLNQFTKYSRLQWNLLNR